MKIIIVVRLVVCEYGGLVVEFIINGDVFVIVWSIGDEVDL